MPDYQCFISITYNFNKIRRFYLQFVKRHQTATRILSAGFFYFFAGFFYLQSVTFQERFAENYQMPDYQCFTYYYYFIAFCAYLLTDCKVTSVNTLQSVTLYLLTCTISGS